MDIQQLNHIFSRLPGQQRNEEFSYNVKQTIPRNGLFFTDDQNVELSRYEFNEIDEVSVTSPESFEIKVRVQSQPFSWILTTKIFESMEGDEIRRNFLNLQGLEQYGLSGIWNDLVPQRDSLLNPSTRRLRIPQLAREAFPPSLHNQPQHEEPLSEAPDGDQVSVLHAPIPPNQLQNVNVQPPSAVPVGAEIHVRRPESEAQRPRRLPHSRRSDQSVRISSRLRSVPPRRLYVHLHLHIQSAQQESRTQSSRQTFAAQTQDLLASAEASAISFIRSPAAIPVPPPLPPPQRRAEHPLGGSRPDIVAALHSNQMFRRRQQMEQAQALQNAQHNISLAPPGD